MRDISIGIIIIIIIIIISIISIIIIIIVVTIATSTVPHWSAPELLYRRSLPSCLLFPPGSIKLSLLARFYCCFCDCIVIGAC